MRFSIAVVWWLGMLKPRERTLLWSGQKTEGESSWLHIRQLLSSQSQHSVRGSDRDSLGAVVGLLWWLSAGHLSGLLSPICFLGDAFVDFREQAA